MFKKIRAVLAALPAALLTAAVFPGLRISGEAPAGNPPVVNQTAGEAAAGVAPPAGPTSGPADLSGVEAGVGEAAGRVNSPENPSGGGPACAGETRGNPKADTADGGDPTDWKERVARLEKQASEQTARAGQLEAGLQTAVSRYRELLARANPEILPELIEGDSIEALDSSLEKARALTGRIRANLAAHYRAARIPAGAPARGGEDVSGLSAREKINRGIRGR